MRLEGRLKKEVGSMICGDTDAKIKKEMNHQLNMWRTDLTNYESKQFIPFVVTYVDGFIEYFEKIISMCEECSERPIFWPQLTTLLEQFGQPTDGNGARFTAKTYYMQISNMAKTSYLEPLKKLKENSTKIKDLGSLSLWLNELKLIASSILNVKYKLFLFRLSGWFAIRNLESGHIHDPLPSPELTIFFVPFNAINENLITESTYLLGSIEAWSNEQLEWKTSYLNALASKINLKNTKWTLYVNLIVVAVAVFLSWFFLVAASPFDILKQNIENEKLKKQIMELSETSNQALELEKNKSINLEKQINMLHGEIELIKSTGPKSKKPKATSTNNWNQGPTFKEKEDHK